MKRFGIVLLSMGLIFLLSACLGDPKSRLNAKELDLTGLLNASEPPEAGEFSEIPIPTEFLERASDELPDLTLEESLQEIDRIGKLIYGEEYEERKDQYDVNHIGLDSNMVGFGRLNGYLYWVYRNRIGTVVVEYDQNERKIVSETQTEGNWTEHTNDIEIIYLHSYGNRLFWIETAWINDAIDGETAIFEYNIETRELVLVAEYPHWVEFTLYEPYLLIKDLVRYGNRQFHHLFTCNLDSGEVVAFTSDELRLPEDFTLVSITNGAIRNGTITYMEPSADADGNPCTYITTRVISTKEIKHRVQVPGTVTQALRGDEYLAWNGDNGAYLYNGKTVRLLHAPLRDTELTFRAEDKYLVMNVYGYKRGNHYRGDYYYQPTDNTVFFVDWLTLPSGWVLR